MGSAKHAEAETNGVSEEEKETESGEEEIPKEKRKRIVVAGLGMVGMAFVEKLLKLDEKRSEYHVIVVGEEPHLAYNRVGLTSYVRFTSTPSSQILLAASYYRLSSILKWL